MGSLRFRRSFKLAPGVRLNLNKRSVGLSAGVRGARVSVNSDGRSTRSIGIPGTGLSYRTQTRGRRHTTASGAEILSPTRLIASLVGWLTVLVFVIAIFGGHAHFAGMLIAIGIITYVVLRFLRGILDPMLLWFLTRTG